MRLIWLILLSLLVLLSACSEEPPPPPVEESPTITPPTAVPAQTVSSNQVCPDFVQDALSEVDGTCDATGRNQACYGNMQISASPKSSDTELQFQQPGDIVDVVDIGSLRLDPLNLDSEIWGVALLRLQANLDDTNPGQNVTFLMFGDVELENRTSDNTTNINSFYFSSGIGDAACKSAPESGLLIQTPEGVGKVDLLLNEVGISIGSTAYLQAQPNADMVINVVEGQADVTSQGVTESVVAGNRTTIELDENGIADSPPTPPEPYETEPLRQLPINNLPRPIMITERTLNLGNPSDPADRLIATGSGEIVTEGAIDEYPLTVEAGQRIYLDGLEDSTRNIYWNLYSEDDDRILLFTQAYNDLGAHVFEEAGTYIIRIWGDDSTVGTYNFQVWDAPISQQELTLPTNPPAQLIGLGAGEIETVGTVDEFSLTVEAGQRVYLDGLEDSTRNIYWNLYSADDDRILLFTQAYNDLGAYVFEEAGTYIIRIWGDNSTVGTYNFQVWNAPISQQELTLAADPPAQLIGLGTGEIETVGTVDEFPITVEAGQRVYFDGLEDSTRNIYWNLYTADDDRILLFTQSYNDLGAYVFEEAGIYIIRIWGDDSTVGTYNFQVWNAPISQQELTLPTDPPAQLIGLGTGEIETVGTVDEFPITVEAGQQVYFDGLEDSTRNIYWNLYTADNDRILLFTQSYNDLGAHVFEEAGTYIIRVWGDDSTVGTYAFEVREGDE
jgi:hypothetical protein